MRSLPTAPDAERAVIAEILATRGDALMNVEFLKGEHFAERANREIFEAAHGIWEGGGKPDAVVISESLRETGSPVSRSTVESYRQYRGDAESFVDSAKLVHAKFISREIIGLGEEISERGLREEPWSVLDAAESRISELRPTTGTGLAKVLSSGTSDFGVTTRITSGFPALDAYLGNLVGGRLVTIASRPGVGKTTLAFDIASNAAALGHKVAAFSLEMSSDEITERLIYKTSSVNQYKFKQGLAPEDTQNVARALLTMSEWELYIDDTSGLSAYEISSKAKKLKHDKGLDLVVIDYLQLVSAAKADSREQEVAGVVRAFKHLARELGVPVLMLSQLSRAAEVRGGKPRMSDLRESGGIENDADQIVILWRADESDGDGLAYTYIAVIKNRHGPSGDLPPIGLVRGLSKFE
jgi:replicative DNA helicase